MDTLSWFDDLLAGDVVPPPDVEVAPAADVDEVNRLLRKRRALLDKQANLDKIRDREVQRITEWHFEQTGVVEGAVGRIDLALEGWVRAEFSLSGTRTHNLPFGVLRIRSSQGKVIEAAEGAADVVAADERFVERELVRTTHELAKKEIKARCDRGEKISETVDRVMYQAVLRLADPETGEVATVVLPGVVFEVPVPGVLGMNVTVQQ